MKRRSVQARPRYLDALDSRGFVNLKLGQPKNAIADYDAALRIDPKHPSALYGRGIAKRRTGNTETWWREHGRGETHPPRHVPTSFRYGIP